MNYKMLLATLFALLAGAAFAQYGGSYNSPSSSSTVGLEGMVHLAMPVLAVAMLGWILLPLIVIWKLGDNPAWAMVGVISSASSLGVFFVMLYVMFMGILLSGYGGYGYGTSMSSLTNVMGSYSLIFLLETGLSVLTWMILPLLLLQKVLKVPSKAT